MQCVCNCLNLFFGDHEGVSVIHINFGVGSSKTSNNCICFPLILENRSNVLRENVSMAASLSGFLWLHSTNLDKWSRLGQCRQWSTDAVVTDATLGPRGEICHLSRTTAIWWKIIYTPDTVVFTCAKNVKTMWNQTLIWYSVARRWFFMVHYEQYAVSYYIIHFNY